MGGKKNVTTPDNFVTTKNRANDRKTLSRRLKTLSLQMKREINEDTRKQCRDIKSDCHDIKNCRRKKVCRDISELSRDRSWQIMKASHDRVCYNKEFDFATNISESETFKA